MRRQWLSWATFAILIGLLVLIVYAVSGRITEELCTSIRVGMTKKEVEQIMWYGGRDVEDPSYNYSDIFVTSWSDAQGTVHVYFDHKDRVTEVRYFGATHPGFWGYVTRR